MLGLGIVLAALAILFIVFTIWRDSKRDERRTQEKLEEALQKRNPKNKPRN
jgi:Flp pilus assembly protein TadB